MNVLFADNNHMAALNTLLPLRRMFTIAVTAVLAVASVTPALAADQPSGLDLARDVATRAVALASNPGDADVADTTPPVVGDRGKSGEAKDKGKGKGKGNNNPGTDSGAPNQSGDGEKLTGRARAAAAIAEAFAGSVGNGNGFGRGHAAVVIGTLLMGESPASLAHSETHGAKVSAMVATYNELKAQDAAGG